MRFRLLDRGAGALGVSQWRTNRSLTFAALNGFVAIAVLGQGQAPQGQQPPVAANAAISGTVRDKNTGEPLKEYTISTYVNVTWANGGVTMSPSTKEVTAKTDESGRYRLGDLPAATYHVLAQGAAGGPGGRVERIVTLAGQDVGSIDFLFVQPASITGKIIDENEDPVPGMTVTLVSKEYYLGSVGYYLSGGAITNDLGEFTISHVEAGRQFYLLAEMNPSRMPAHAETPLNPKMRRRIPMRTWYPSSPDREGAAPIVLRASEKREGIDIEVKKSASYCVSGIAMTPNGPGALNVSIVPLAPSSGISNGGGMFRFTPMATTAADGEFRICDLFPGAYRMTVSERNQSPDSTYAFASVTIGDEDIAGLRVPTSMRQSMEAEVVLDGPVPQTPITARVNVSLSPMFRTQMPGERAGGRSDGPGTISLSGLMLDDYAVRATINSPGLYIKDVTFAGRSVQFEPLHLANAMAGSGLRVTVGQDGAHFTANVADKDGNPVSDVRIIAMPADAPSEGVLAARIVQGRTNQSGQYTSETMAPGKYYVVATQDPFDMTTESVGKLWSSHDRYQEIDLQPNGGAAVTLLPIGIQ